MNINELIAIVKNKLESKISIENIIIQDKSFLHKSHKNHQDGKYHLKLFIKSKELSNFTKLDVVALGGISRNNLKKLNFLNQSDFAGISFFE